MYYTKLGDLLSKADAEGYAIPSFNYSDVWDLMAIVEAAEEESAPIMVASNPLVVQVFSPEACGVYGQVIMKRASTPIVHHLDHSFSVDLCSECIRYGYPSVMIDASKFNLETNIEIVNQVMSVAIPAGVHVEAEVGKIMGKGIEGDFEGGDFLVEVEDAVTLVRQTGVGSLAIGIGSAHGFYKGKPQLNFKRLEEVNKAIDTPLVLHGGTGIPEEDVQRAIRLGINKVNVGTIIHCTYMNSLRAELNRVGDNAYTLDVMRNVRNDIKEVVKGWIRTCMANNKA